MNTEPAFRLDGTAGGAVKAWLAYGIGALLVLGVCAAVVGLPLVVLAGEEGPLPLAVGQAFLTGLGAVVLGGLPALAGLALREWACERVSELKADASGVEVRTLPRTRERVPWPVLREVEFRRLSVRFRATPPGGPRRRFLLSIHWSRAEDLIRLKNFFAERMAEAGRVAAGAVDAGGASEAGGP